jgi:hypothetical protein
MLYSSKNKGESKKQMKKVVALMVSFILMMNITGCKC